jgi:hypothetical protein
MISAPVYSDNICVRELISRERRKTFLLGKIRGKGTLNKDRKWRRGRDSNPRYAV